MKKIAFISLAIILFCTACAPGAPKRYQVGVFDGFGGSQTCIWESLAACSLDPDLDARLITTSDIADGVLDSLDAIVIPGGSGSRQYLNLGAQNLARVRDFVARGGGAVGICAGAYFFSERPDGASLPLSGARAIDIEHDNRGHGNVAFTLTDEGRQLFGEYAALDTLYCMYYEGPVLVPVGAYTEFATMRSDVHEEGDAPAGMTVGRPFFLGTEFGKGRVFCSIAHPEATPGKMWMISRMVRWTLGEDAPLQRFASAPALQDASLVDRECLMTLDDIDREATCFKTLLTGTAAEKCAALDWLKAHSSWDAKRWVQGLLFDADPSVRVAAAAYIADIHYLSYLKDVETLYRTETEPEAREAIGNSLARLRSLRPE